MDEPTLKYKRETLLDSLRAQLAEREQKREEERQKAAGRNQEAVDQLAELFAKYPQFLVWAVNKLEQAWGGDARPGTPEFQKAVEQAYDHTADGVYDPDGSLKRLIRVYEKAEDDVVAVSVRDEVYNYL